MGELSVADRMLLSVQPNLRVIDRHAPTDQQWHWRVKGPTRPRGPNESPELELWTSSLGELEAKGMVWRGTITEDVRSVEQGISPHPASILRGWGLTWEGLKTRKAIFAAREPQEWARWAKFWNELPGVLAKAAQSPPQNAL